MIGFESKNYYELLGVSRDATIDAIKEAYRDIARVYHPDSNFYTEIIEVNLSAEELKVFKLVTAAYNTLVNKQRREEYNQSLPPELPGWEDAERIGSAGGGRSDAFVILEKARRRTASSYSTFGTFAPNVDERGESSAQAKARPVSDLLKEQRTASTSTRLVWALGGTAALLTVVLVFVLLST